MYGYIYLTTNLINNKKYIGKHKASEFDIKYKGSGKILKQAFEKDSFENFSCIILAECENEAELNNLEEFYIDKFNCVNRDDFYNIKPGGLGKSQSGLRYIRNINSGKCKKVPIDDVQRFLETGDWELGGPIPSKDVVLKRALSNTGKKRSAEAKEHISSSLKGRQLSEEHKKALRHPKSVKDYKTGKIQVHKDNNYIFIDKEDLESYQNLGYVKGGKPKSKEHHINVSLGKRNKIKIIHKDTNTIKYINETDLQKYLEEGYKRP